MTISSTQNKVAIGGNGINTSFNFSFVGGDSTWLSVYYTDPYGNVTLLNSSQYTLYLNAAPAGSIWGVGGTVIYPLVGSAIPSGSLITIVREVPLQQTTSLTNQNALFPTAVERALDIEEMQVQQINELNSRAIVTPVADANAPTPLPAAAARAGKYMAFDQNGNPIVAAGTGITFYARTEFTATSGQTLFAVPYTVGFIQVWANGVLLSTGDYTASNGNSVTLNTGRLVGDNIVFIAS